MGFGSELWDNFGACVDRTEEGLQALKIAEEFFRKVRGKQSCILLGGGLGGSGRPVGGYFYFCVMLGQWSGPTLWSRPCPAAPGVWF